MFLLGKLHRYCLKCRAPILYVHQMAKGISSHKNLIRQQKTHTISNISSAQLQVIGSGAADQPASVILRVLNKLYLFNCGEGIKRYCQDSQINFKKITNVFFTQSKWNCIGGIINLVYATFAHTHQLPKFHGPNNLQTIFQRMICLSSRTHSIQNYFTSDIFTSNERYEDNRIVIEPIELRVENDTTIIYVCKIKQHRGNYSLQKVKDRQIPIELIPKLLRGEDVTLIDGTKITSDELRLPDMPEIVFMLIDVPNDGFLPVLEANEKLKNLLDEFKSTGIEVIVHFTPQNIFNTEIYQHFVRRVGAKRQLIVNDRNKYATMKKAFRLQNKLNKIDSKIHPTLSMRLDPDPKIYSPSDDSDANTEQDETTTLFTKYIFWEQVSDNSDDNDAISGQKYDNNDKNDGISLEDVTVKELDRALRGKEEEEDIKSQPVQLVQPKLKDEKFPRMLFLGTSAAGSFPLRNSSGILVHLSKDHSILLDCGTSICSQINRFYGDEAPEIYRRLKAVFVSHMHMDHFIGLPELFRWRQIHLPSKREPLRVFCPLNDLKSWLMFYTKHVEPIYSDIKFIDNEILLKDNLSYKERLYLNIESIVTCPVKHYRKSYALSMILPYQDGDKHGQFKLAYSGDTGLSDAFVKIGQNADLLIHEATYQSELKELAQKHNHSTVAMAVEQAQRMHAKYTILTHFSSRYTILPYIRPNELTENVGIAFDYMEIQPNDLPRLNALIGKYQEAFPAVKVPLEQQTKKYLLQNRLLMDTMPFE